MELNSTLADFQALIAGTGTILNLRITVSGESNNEEFAFDHFTLESAIDSNAAPAITVGNLNYTEGDNFSNGVQIDGEATLNDADGDADWDGGMLTVQITANSEATDEISIPDDIVGVINTNGLNLRDGATVIGTLSAAEGTVTGGTTLTITFNASATNARVQDVLRAISYRTTSDTPNESSRTVTFVATDKNSAVVNDTATINVTDAPETVSMTVSTDMGTEAGQTVIVVTAVASGNVTGAQTVNVSAAGPGITAGDYVFSNTTITIPNGQTTGSVTFTIQDDLIGEFVETATLEFSSPSSGILLGPDTHRDVTITDNDSGFFDFVKTAAATANGYTAVLGSSAYSVGAGFGWINSTLTESFDTGAGSASELLRDYHFIRFGLKTFQVDLPNGDYDVRIGIGSTVHKFANEAVYINGIQVDVLTVPAGTFQNPVYPVTVTGGKLEVTIERQGGTIVGINELSITRANGIPVIATSPTTMNYATGDPATPVDPGLTVRDSDSANLVGATVSITGGFVNTEDVLQFTNQNGITGNYVAATGVLTLTGSSSLANYQAALSSVRYLNTSGTPVLQTRTLTFLVDDGTNTASATRKIAVHNPASQVSANFDFNKVAGGNAAGSTSILSTSAYNSAVGYGWTGTGAPESFDTGSGSATDVERDYHFIRSGSRTFRADVPNGQYDIQYTTGSTIHKFTNVGIIINGTQVDTVSTAVNEFLTKSYMVSVTNGRIEFTIERQGGTFAAVSGLEIAPTPPPLLTAPGFARPVSFLPALTQSELKTVVDQAIGIWTTTGLAAADLIALQSVNVQIANLPGNRLGQATRSLITIDDDASGYGWSLYGANLPGRMDLLTAVLHEMGHVLGHDDDYDPDHSGDIMSGTLAPSQTRTLPADESALLPSLDSLFSTSDRDDELSLFGLL